jgi:AcrR family transcriptional regulator
VSPQPSHRAHLIEGALRCLERLPPERITARAIADESGANLGSIAYHFGSKDVLVTEAVVEGLDRWLAEVSESLKSPSSSDRVTRLQRAWHSMEASRLRHRGLVRNFIAALARAQHAPQIRKRLAEGFSKTRPPIAGLLALGTDQAGRDAAGLLHAMFVGMLLQTSLDRDLTIEGTRLGRALARLRLALPTTPTERAAKDTR